MISFKRCGMAAVLGASLLAANHSALAAPVAPKNTKAVKQTQTLKTRGRFVDIGGVWIWVAEAGNPKGEPLVLMHGALGDADALLHSLGAYLADYRIIAFDRAGHGRSAPRKGEMSYEAMAAETAAVLDKLLGGRAATLVGWSDGGVTSLYMALRYPQSVSRVVTMGSNFHFNGYIKTDLSHTNDENSPALAAYLRHRGNTAEKFARLAEASMKMWTHSPALTAADLANIKVPVLFAVGDDDTVSIAHGVEALEALPMGRLAVVPGSSHFMPVERPDLIAPMIRAFLTEKNIPQTLHPVRRQAQ